MKNEEMNDIVNFLFEAGMLARTPRSFASFLGSGDQSVAEHINRVSYIGYVLATMDKRADISKVLKMCLFHDIAEARVSDLNYVHQKYTEKKEEEAVKDLTETLPFGKDMRELIEEYERRESREACLVKDADNLEFLLSLKEQVDTGNERARTWMPPLMKRFITQEAKELAKVIMKTDSDKWWFRDKEDSWWVNRGKK